MQSDKLIFQGTRESDRTIDLTRFRRRSWQSLFSLVPMLMTPWEGETEDDLMM